MSFAAVIGIAICSAVITGIVKRLDNGLSVYVGVGCAVVLTYFALGYFRPLAELFSKLSALEGVGGYAKTVFKLAAIGTLTCIASDICSDMGENSIASKIELVGKGASCVAVVPVLEDLIYSVIDFLM
ncbi:MAG: hypothetical protein E7583_02830 [Ruminococcaceae bacterium]|nr:hypothetical protein [Oscillospiraceae bacterium]